MSNFFVSSTLQTAKWFFLRYKERRLGNEVVATIFMRMRVERLCGKSLEQNIKGERENENIYRTHIFFFFLFFQNHGIDSQEDLT